MENGLKEYSGTNSPSSSDSAARTLSATGTTSPDLMTLAICTAFCTYKRGVFAFAGVEYGQVNKILFPADIIITDDV